MRPVTGHRASATPAVAPVSSDMVSATAARATIVRGLKVRCMPVTIGREPVDYL
jgi:hypothetical protein